MALEIILNGQPRAFAELEAGATIVDLISALDVKSDRVAIEHNGEIASRAAWRQLPLVNGDRIELVHFVGGGSGSEGIAWSQADLASAQRSLR